MFIAVGFGGDVAVGAANLDMSNGCNPAYRFLQVFSVLKIFIIRQPRISTALDASEKSQLITFVLIIYKK